MPEDGAKSRSAFPARIRVRRPWNSRKLTSISVRAEELITLRSSSSKPSRIAAAGGWAESWCIQKSQKGCGGSATFCLRSARDLVACSQFGSPSHQTQLQRGQAGMPAACSCSQTVAEQRPQTLIAVKSCRGASPDGEDEGRLCATGEASESGSAGELGIYTKMPDVLELE